MGSLNYLGGVFTESTRDLLSLIYSASLNIFWAFVIFALGLALGHWVQVLARKAFEILKLEDLSKTIGVGKFLKKMEVEAKLQDLISGALRWIVVLIFFISALDILGLSSISQVLLSILSYVPSVVAALFVFFLGYFVASFVEKLVKGAIASLDKDLAKPLSIFARWLILVIAFFAALDQLKIAQTLTNTFFQGLTYTFVLAIGLSFGLGAKDLVSRILNDWYEKLNKK